MQAYSTQYKASEPVHQQAQQAAGAQPIQYMGQPQPQQGQPIQGVQVVAQPAMGQQQATATAYIVGGPQAVQQPTQGNAMSYAMGGGGVVVVGQPIAMIPNTIQTVQISDPNAPPVGRFKDGLCDCCNNMLPSCCMGCWCNCILLGQIWEKLGRGKCWAVVVTFLLLWLIYCIMGAVLPDMQGIIGIALWVTACVFTCNARQDIIHKYQIQNDGNCTDGCGNCCVSCCCIPCALCQMARHLHNYKGQMDECSCDSKGDLTSEKLGVPQV